MTGQIAGSSMLPLEIVVVAIGLSMVAGVADVVRLPGWAWRKAEEPKIAYLALVALLPAIGLGMYLVRARPKVRAVAAAGRAASLPFERFGDGAPSMDEEQVAEAPEPIQLVAVKPDLASTLAAAPATTAAPVSPVVEPAAPLRPEEPAVEEAPAEQETPEPVVVGGDMFFSARRESGTRRSVPEAETVAAPAPAPEPETVAAAAPAAAMPSMATATLVAEPEGAETVESPEIGTTEPMAAATTSTAASGLRLPASLASRQYKPRQRASISDGRLTQPVPAGWKADPTGRHQFRYWNGRHWTENVADAGVQDRDAVCA